MVAATGATIADEDMLVGQAYQIAALGTTSTLTRGTYTYGVSAVTISGETPAIYNSVLSNSTINHNYINEFRVNKKREFFKIEKHEKFEMNDKLIHPFDLKKEKKIEQRSNQTNGESGNLNQQGEVARGNPQVPQQTVHVFAVPEL